jgi:hypothetical protein
MKHHLVFYGPLQKQRSAKYHDATNDGPSLGNIGLEWLIPAALLIVAMVAVFHFLHVLLVYELFSLGTILVWIGRFAAVANHMLHAKACVTVIESVP